jgi:hypothetical protein
VARVFICYRRGDVRWAAGRLYDRLVHVLGGDNVFLDVSNIEPGEDYFAKIEKVVGSCDVLLALIGPDWCELLDRFDRDSGSDLLIRELTTALKRNIRVVPILIDGASMPSPSRLPEEIRPLTRRNARELSFAGFHADLDSLIRVLERVLSQPGLAERDARGKEGAKKAAVSFTQLPYTLACETLGGEATALIPRGSALPAEITEVFSTAEDNQASVEVHLLIGEQNAAKDCISVGRFRLDGLPPAAKGTPKIEVKAAIDPSLMLTVTGLDRATNRREVLDAIDLRQIAPVDPAAQDPRSHDKAAPLQIALTAEEARAGCAREVRLPDGRKIRLKVPAGVQDGARIRLKGANRSNVEPGDLYILARVVE